MNKAKLFTDKHFVIGDVDDKMYASFTEHLGRCIYEGIYEPGHPEADEDGFRKDVMGLIQDLNVPVVRYPGGNFVSLYDWHDGIGPKENRPKRMEYAWSSIETNQFGIDDFCKWAKKMNIEPMIAVNLGTGNIKDAGDLVEYCNHPGGTYWSDLRIANGGPKEGYGIKYWCLGNEMEGSWQAGHLSAEDYTKKALEAAKIMRWVDPTIKLIACGSSYDALPTYLEWDRVMMSELWDYVDYLSTHNYTSNLQQGNLNYVASYKQLDDHIKNSVKVLDFVKVWKRKKNDIKICLDEWNVWNFQDINIGSTSDLGGVTTFSCTSAEPWEIAPPILQEKYSLLDAIVEGGLGITLLNNADTVEIACLAQLVNAIAPITTDRATGKAFKQSIYYPFELLSKYGRGTALKPVVDSDKYQSMYGELNIVEPAVIYDEKNDELHVFVINADENNDTELDMEFAGYGDRKVVKHIAICGDDLDAINTVDEEKVAPVEIAASNESKAVLPKLSFNVLVLK